MLLKKLTSYAALFAVVLVGSNAEAITIGGVDYNKILTVTSNQDFGYWTGADKFYTFQSNDNYIKPINVNKVTYRDADLNGIDIQQVFAMGAVDGDQGPLTMGNVNLLGRSGASLLTTDYVSNGKLDAIYKSGSAGQLNVNGVFNVTGGSLFTSGLITGNVYVEIAFDYVWQNKYKDLKVRYGTFTFYEAVGGGNNNGGNNGPTEVPEPATVALLASSLLGGAKLRRKRQA